MQNTLYNCPTPLQASLHSFYICSLKLLKRKQRIIESYFQSETSARFFRRLWHKVCSGTSSWWVSRSATSPHWQRNSRARGIAWRPSWKTLVWLPSSRREATSCWWMSHLSVSYWRFRMTSLTHLHRWLLQVVWIKYTSAHFYCDLEGPCWTQCSCVLCCRSGPVTYGWWWSLWLQVCEVDD